MKREAQALQFMFGLMLESDRRLLAGHVAVTLANVAAALLLAIGIRPLIDGAVARDHGSLVLGGVVSLIGLVVMLLTPVAQRNIVARSIENLIVVMQRKIIRVASEAPGVEQFEVAGYWDKLQVMKRNLGSVLQGLMGLFVAPVVTLQLIIAGVVLFQVSPWLLPLPVVIAPALWLNRRATAIDQASEERVSSARRVASGLFNAASSPDAGKEIRVFQLRDELLKRYDAQAGDVLADRARARAAGFGLRVLSSLLVAAVFIASVIFVARLAISGRISLGDVALTLSMAGVLVAATNTYTGLSSVILRAVTLAQSHQSLIDEIEVRSESLRAAGPSPRHLNGAAGEPIRLENVSFSYLPAAGNVLSDVSLTLPSSGVVAIVGENGAGKTTLVKLLSRMYAPTTGRILIGDQNIREFDLSSYRSRLSACFQDFVRYEFSARECVRIGAVGTDDGARTERALERARCGFVHDLPDGLDTQLGTGWPGGVDLSGGQWQRLALARSMIRDRLRLAVYDEPTAGLDPRAEYEIFSDIAGPARGSAGLTILISHRFTTVRMADLIIVLEKGRIAEQGSHPELVSSGGLYAELYELQARAYR
ncbi:ABC transporter ATP-binding protein [Kribbella sp. NPDC050820]|uniref:ABC transporter ATP-binding protein n=1 Tax=Kribbella sp. NPDC050820 TaxID=3155408 RepID=UPI003410F8C2